ncbi:hypothetical protein BamIOP4010DRAFT_3605 [Burkholderia ambifaria IOP40-10]|uniref:Uncharacterized protein n=1 Tax=Burkholderia ambifaria IOP40-10 TaxID=396596 RepID=B1FHU5_9BURK|nr:hypothetical protein BamIOP4010DRAFT_3605 [Burkholderia ambifaria IOP40-10]
MRRSRFRLGIDSRRFPRAGHRRRVASAGCRTAPAAGGCAPPLRGLAGRPRCFIVRDRRSGTFNLAVRLHGTVGEHRLECPAHRRGIRRRTIRVRRGRVARFRHAAGLHLAVAACRLTGRGHAIGVLRCVGIGRARDLGIGHITVSTRRCRSCRRRDVGSLLHRIDSVAVRIRSVAGRGESVQHRLATGVLAGRNSVRLDIRHRVIARGDRRTRRRLEHRIAEQVERAFVPRRIAARRVTGPRGGLGGGVCRGRDGARARMGRRAVGAGTGARQGNGFGHGVGLQARERGIGGRTESATAIVA